MAAALSAALAVSALAGCTSGQTTTSSTGGAAATKSGQLTIAVLQKQGDQQYFVDEAQGAKDAAKKDGKVTVKVINLGTDANLAISQLNAVVAQKVDGILIVVPDQKIGPQVISAAKAANIPLMEMDDPIKDASGAAARFTGFDSISMGSIAGKKAGELYAAAGWSAADTRIISAYQQNLSDCTDRAKGELDAFTKSIGSARVPQVIDVGTDNSSTNAQDKAGAAITANPGVKHWITWGCNDDNETGVVTALQNSGVKPADIIGVGLGAYLTCKDWKAGQVTGNKASVFVSGIATGTTAMTAMLELLRKGTPLPPTSIAPTEEVDASNYVAVGVKCN